MCVKANVTVTQVMALLPSAKRDTIYSDSILARVAARIPENTLIAAATVLAKPGTLQAKPAVGTDHAKDGAEPWTFMPAHVLDEARRAGGPLTRAALASAVPAVFLQVHAPWFAAAPCVCVSPRLGMSRIPIQRCGGQLWLPLQCKSRCCQTTPSWWCRCVLYRSRVAVAELYGCLMMTVGALAQLLRAVMCDSPDADDALRSAIGGRGAAAWRVTPTASSARADMDTRMLDEGAKLRLEAGEYETFEAAASLLARVAVLCGGDLAYSVQAVVSAAHGDVDEAAVQEPAQAAIVGAVVGRLLRGAAVTSLTDPQVRGAPGPAVRGVHASSRVWAAEPAIARHHRGTRLGGGWCQCPRAAAICN